jgi:hypothetical protein
MMQRHYLGEHFWRGNAALDTYDALVANACLGEFA